MRVYWKALIGYGFIFWVVLCVTDFLGITDIHKYSKDLDELYDKPVIITNIEKRLESHLDGLNYKGLKFGWALIIWNLVTFVFSFVICSLGQIIAWTCWAYYRSYKNKFLGSSLISSNHSGRNISRIPIMVKQATRFSDTNLPSFQAKSKMETEKSCPNLSMRRSGSNVSSSTDVTTKSCRTIYKRDLYLCANPALSNEQQLEKQCKLLKEELLRLQTTSLKEHAILSRKLDYINKEKKDISKQLSIMQKENRAAKEQLEELLREKSSLLKKLANATKEFKCNTKSKKFALAKLAEVTTTMNELRQQLEQVSRDKEILEKKLKLLEIEYNKLHERYIASQQKLFIKNSRNENLPERDDNNDKEKRKYLEQLSYDQMGNNNIPPVLQQTAEALVSVSQTELDMKKIQDKIKQLEKNLENLNMRDNDVDYSQSLEQIGSETSLSALDNTTDSQPKMCDESGTNFSEFSGTSSPRSRYWPHTVTDLFRRSQLSKMQILTLKEQRKASPLNNTRDVETTDSDDIKPKRLVSSSVPFKNFLKSLNKLDATKKEIPYNPHGYF